MDTWLGIVVSATTADTKKSPFIVHYICVAVSYSDGIAISTQTSAQYYYWAQHSGFIQ